MCCCSLCRISSPKLWVARRYDPSGIHQGDHDVQCFYDSDFGQGKQDKSEQVNADESIIQRNSGFMVQLYE
jgi:hypothetical protein